MQNEVELFKRVAKSEMEFAIKDMKTGMSLSLKHITKTFE